jgi:PAS domain S-box-containing protein
VEASNKPAAASLLSDLVHSGQLSAAVLAALPGIAVLVFDRDLRYSLAAGQALERHGFTADQLEGHTLHEVLPADFVEKIEPHYRAALAGEVVRFDANSIDNTAVYRTDIAPIRQGGEVVAGVAVSRDVTETVLATTKLTASERSYRLLAERATDLISRHTADGTFLYASPAARELTGYEPEELVGQNALAHHHRADVEAERDHWKLVLSSTEPRKIEYRIRRRDGSWAWVESIVRSVRDEKSGDVEIEAVTRDITERKHREQELREAHERFEAAFRDAPIGKAIVALDGMWLKVNRALCELTGYDEDELVGMTFQDLSHPDDAQADIEQVGRLLSGEIRSYRIEKRYVRSDGSTVWIALSGSLVRDDDNRPLYLIAQVEDIGDRKRAEQDRERLLAREREQTERLRQLDKLKDEFVSFVSHELRTPLTSILGYVELLIEHEADFSDEQQRFLGTVERNGQRLNRLIEDLLAYFRIEDGNVEMHPERLDLTELLTEAVESAGPAAVRKQLSLATRFTPTAPVIGDEGRLAQVIDNLISNAIKYTPEGGEIRVSLVVEDGSVVLSVADTGIGIPEEERERLFERFFRASTATERAIPGTGLGLAIAKGLVEAHGGSIGAAPCDPGTRFTVTLPLATDAAPLDLPAAPFGAPAAISA